MRFLALLFIGLAIIADPAYADPPPAAQSQAVATVSDKEDAMDDAARSELKLIIAKIDKQDQALISDIPDEKEVIELHLTIGVWIRNQVRAGKLPSLFHWSQAHADKNDKTFDGATWPIVVAVWRTLKYSPEYKDIRGLHLDPKKISFERTMDAANRGDRQADFFVGMAYQAGTKFVKQDYAEAAKWYYKAVKQDYGGAAWSLAPLYEHGLGVKQNYQEAYFWWSIATNQLDKGVENEQQNQKRVRAHLTDDQVAVVNKRVVDWYKTLAEEGNKDALVELGRLYTRGEHVKQDYEEATFWKMLAEKSRAQIYGEPTSKDCMKFLTPEQLATVEKRVDEWRPFPAPLAATKP